MLCVSIGRGRHKHMMAEHCHLVEQGAKLVELRLDYIRRTVNLKRLLANRPCPVIVTCRRQEDGGKWEGSEDQRLILLRSAIAEGVEYVDLEEDVAGSVPRFGATKRIVSLHNFRETPEDLHAVHQRLAALDADIVKIATMAHNPEDSLRMLRLIQESSLPTVGMCMGDIGTPSRILAGRFGAPFTYATFHQERALAPGQLSYRQMTDIYGYESINAETDVLGVIADPIGHSLSPIVHNAAFRELGMNKVYVPFRVPREHLNTFLRDSRELGIRGLSVTIPHKEAVMHSLDSLDDAAAGIGAVNTILFKGQRSVGYNTDCQAVLDSLAKVTGVTGEGTYNKTSVLVLGAGGVAKAIGYGLTKKGAHVTIAARKPEKGRALAESLQCDSVDWEDRHRVRAKILINGTPVGMHPNVDESPYQREHLQRGMVVFDTVYNPEQTLLIKDAKKHGCQVVTGVAMFVRQAAIQFRLFTGTKAPRDLMREQVKRAIGPAQY